MRVISFHLCLLLWRLAVEILLITVPNRRIPIISLGLEIIFCSNRSYAHSSAVFRALLSSSADVWTIVGETCIKNKMASFWSRYCYDNQQPLSVVGTFSSTSSSSSSLFGSRSCQGASSAMTVGGVLSLDWVLVVASRVIYEWGKSPNQILIARDW